MPYALEQEINQLHAEICAGLADPKRILILYALHEKPRNVNELVELLDLSQPMVSRHLKVLTRARHGDHQPHRCHRGVQPGRRAPDRSTRPAARVLANKLKGQAALANTFNNLPNNTHFESRTIQ